VTLHPYATVSYRKTPHPPAVYSLDIRVVTANCRQRGGEENAITLLPNIFSDGVSEQALTRKMTEEEGRRHNGGCGGTSPQVYQMLLRGDAIERFHCRLCVIGANEGGWKKARDALRHLKRDHFGLGTACTLW